MIRQKAALLLGFKNIGERLGHEPRRHKQRSRNAALVEAILNGRLRERRIGGPPGSSKYIEGVEANMLTMALIAVGVFFADFAAVAAIIGSLFLERWLGFSRGEFLDCIFVVAACSGVAAYLAGRFIWRELKATPESGVSRHSRDETAHSARLTVHSAH